MSPSLYLSILTLCAPAEMPEAAVPAAEPLRMENGPVLQDAEAKEKKPYSGTVNVGVFASFGNTEVTKVNFNAASRYEIDEKNRVSGQFDWFYAEETNQTTKVTTVSQRRIRGAGQFDHKFSKRLYAYARADGTHDGPQALHLRFIVGGGLGYQFVDNDDEKLSAEAGVAWTHEDLKGVPSAEEYLAARLAGKYFRQVTEELRVDATAEWVPSLEDSEDHVVLAMTQAGYNLGKGFQTTLRYEFDYDSTPAPGNDKTDHRVIWGLGYSF